MQNSSNLYNVYLSRNVLVRFVLHMGWNLVSVIKVPMTNKPRHASFVANYQGKVKNAGVYLKDVNISRIMNLLFY